MFVLKKRNNLYLIIKKTKKNKLAYKKNNKILNIKLIKFKFIIIVIFIQNQELISADYIILDIFIKYFLKSNQFQLVVYLFIFINFNSLVL